MTPRDYWGLLRRAWLLIVLMTALGALAALGFSAMTTPIYRAESQLFVSVRSTGDVSGASVGNLYVQQRMKSYLSVVDTPSVLEPLADKLDLDLGSANISAQNPTGTVLLNVLVTDPSAERATQIAEAAAESLAAEIVRLETTESGEKPVDVELIRPAEVPDAPISPRTRINVVLGMVAGFLAGVGIAVLRAKLDTSIKSGDELEAATGATLLGSIGYDPGAKKNPLITLQDNSLAEAYRSIRTNLQYVDVDHPPRCVVITSSMPFEGKSTTAANLAIALAHGGAKVLLVEADLRRPKVAEYLGVDGSVGLTDVLIGRAKVDDAIVHWHRGLLDLLPSGAIPPNPSELLGSQQLADLLTDLGTRYNILVVDAPPLLPVTDAAILAAIADGAIILARYGQTRYEQAEEAAAALSHVHARLLGTVLNFVPDKHGPRGYGYGHAYGYRSDKEGPDNNRALRALREVGEPRREPHPGVTTISPEDSSSAVLGPLESNTLGSAGGRSA